MGCGKKMESPSHKQCVVDAVRSIHDMQEAVEDNCSSSCFCNLLSPKATLGDTVPFILLGKGDFNALKSFGNIGGLVGPDRCFSTIFFRVEKVKGHCATLSLLRPLKKNGEQIDDLHSPCDRHLCALEKTDVCIEVDLECFCAIQCLSPQLVIG
ncbi:CotY/CotZ family spore coat protein [Aureibacillus halotolerans]|nr:CotY/CotZ family spore coat protein [Aureibacillus halotolerans]